MTELIIKCSQKQIDMNSSQESMGFLTGTSISVETG